MRVSVSMYSLNPTIKKENWSVLDFLEYAKRISSDGVELLDMYWRNKDDKFKEIKQVKAALKEHNLAVSAYDITNNFVKQSSEERMEEVEKVKEGIKVAKQLGTNIIRVFAGDLRNGITYQSGKEWIVDCLKQCAVIAEEKEIYLAIENHGLLAGKSEQIEEIIERVNSSYVKATFDTGNFLLVNEMPREAFDRLKEKIVHVHFKDFREKHPNESVKGFQSTEGVGLIGTIPGDGQVDLSYIVDGLKGVHYDGWLSIEYEGIEDAKHATTEAVNRLMTLVN
ncbi:sugar phosphate isomerase/epimerase family protein [Virgibacillus oceani]|uniref:Xylose isomerase-like TIM barrel domain-containing protein n=1 Tax=Virgibacillus oceani TaxID=1479511 RepID=A0A917M255_9BACI|nr:sugar phosphate isomerase/epimerase [Virgibacillus oceani]GGG73003.1 hypothetical protein GCM10011398_16770 [Virgibacillus oceani]